MTYEQAHKIGTAFDGYIKCTYAELHSTQLARVWSLQKSALVYSTAKEDLTQAVSAADETYWITDGGRVVDFPIVQFEGDPVYSPDGKWIQVYTTDYTRDFIYSKAAVKLQRLMGNLSKANDRCEDAYITLKDLQIRYDNNRDVWVNSMEDIEFQKAKKQLEYAQQKYDEYNAYCNDLADALENPVYVKACAIDWIPTNADKMRLEVENDGRIIELNAAIEAAEQKMKTAKAALIAAAGTALIF